MMNDTDDKIRRRKGRPAKTEEAVTVPSYPFPSLDDILRMSDQQIAVGFVELGVEPRPFHWKDDDDQANVSHWHDFGMTMTDTERYASQPKTAAGMRALKASSMAIHLHCLRMQLLAEYLKQWVSTLEDVQLIKEVERLSCEKLSESAKRYAKVADLRDKLEGLVWPTLLEASTLYVWPTNPLTGKSTKEENATGARIVRRNG